MISSQSSSRLVVAFDFMLRSGERWLNINGLFVVIVLSFSAVDRVAIIFDG